MSLIGQVVVGRKDRIPTFSDKEIGVPVIYATMEAYKNDLEDAKEDIKTKTKELQRAKAKLNRLEYYWQIISPKGNSIKIDYDKMYVLTKESNIIVFKPEHLQYALLGSDPEKSLDFVLENYPEPILIENV